jgi:DNA polymerase III delta prime subunit
MSLENLVWELKYRPKLVVNTILPASTRKQINDFMSRGNLPPLLFHGAAGTGKSTLALAIAEETGADLLFINASLDGNIDTLRTSISQFVSTVSFSDSKKMVLLDECDHLNPQSTMPALRGFLDEFSSNSNFIFTANFPNRIIAPLLSRLTCIDFKFSKDDVQLASIQMLKRCCFILDSENIKYDKKSVAALVTKNFPDFRKTIGELQRYSASGEIDTGILVNNDVTNLEELVGFIKNKEFGKCRQWVANNQLDSQTFYRGLYDRLLPLLVSASVPQVILVIADRQHQSVVSVDQEINQIAAITQIMSSATFK